jgi:hypothetical protein
LFAITLVAEVDAFEDDVEEVYLPRIREEEATIPTLMDLCDIMCFA